MKNSERQTAIKRLTDARNKLIEQLSENINLLGDDLTEGLIGGGYRGSAVEEVLESGERLVKLGYLLAHMQADSTSGPGELSDGVREVAPGVYHAGYDPSPYSWDSFVAFVAQRRLNESSTILSELLGINYQLATRCTAHFSARFHANENMTIDSLNRIANQMRNGNPNGAIYLLRDLFNLHGDDALTAYSRLKDSI